MFIPRPCRITILISFLQDSKAISNKSSYIELSTQKGGVFFTTKEMRRLSKEYTETTEAYKRTQTNLVKEVIAIAG